VQVDVGSIGLAEEEALGRIRERGVLLSQTKPGILRAVTHLDVTEDDVERAVELVPQALGGQVHA
jgi:threonine aldolase